MRCLQRTLAEDSLPHDLCKPSGGAFRAFFVLLRSVPRVKPLVYANNIEALLEASGTDSIDIVLLFVAGISGRDGTSQVGLDQIRQLKDVRPNTFCIAFVEFADQRDAARAAGADMVLLEGIPGHKLREAVDTIGNRPTGTP